MQIKEDKINQTKNFVKHSFQENPAYSFNNWMIMYEHSVMVKDIALQIAESVPCNKDLLAIEALLHDIGKVYKADSKFLHKHHAELGYKVAKEFVRQLVLSDSDQKELEAFLKGKTNSTEGKIVKDADIIAFFCDYKLQEAFKIWADVEELSDELQRKADKIDKLEYTSSKEIAERFYVEMKKRWGLK